MDFLVDLFATVLTLTAQSFLYLRTADNTKTKHSSSNLSELLEYAQYVIENSRSVTAEARELRAKLKLDDPNPQR